MTQTGYSSALVSLMLGWLKGLANWVLKLFNLAGSGGSPLMWLSENWLKLLILGLVIGIAMDWLVWMIRWRPYWAWFRKKRIVVNDERMLSDVYGDLEDDEDGFDRRYVVKSTIVSRKPSGQKKLSTNRRSAVTPRPAQRRRVNATVARTTRPAAARATKPIRRAPLRDAVSDELFEVGNTQEEYSDFYEDEVFNVSSLPDRSETLRKNRKRQR